MMRRSIGFWLHAGSANRLSALAAIRSELPRAMSVNSRASEPVRPATVFGCLARLVAMCAQDMFGTMRRPKPVADLMSNMSSGAAISSALRIIGGG